MHKISPIRIQFKSKQQQGLELLLEHYCEMTSVNRYSPNMADAMSHLLIAEWLLKVKQKNILERSSATFTLSPQLRIAVKHASTFILPNHPLAMSVESYLLPLNEKGLGL